jgi:tripartite-type tricarboxylate transporter receptor subunit TctC
MKLARRKFLHLAAVAAALPAVPRIAWAQAYPSRPVRIIVGFAAGGGYDIIARLIGQWLSERLGQPFVIENRPGAATNIATQVVVARRLTAIPSSWLVRQTQSTPHSMGSSISISCATSRQCRASLGSPKSC